MTLQSYLDRRNMTKYQLSKISGVPKTTILDKIYLTTEAVAKISKILQTAG